MVTEAELENGDSEMSFPVESELKELIPDPARSASRASLDTDRLVNELRFERKHLPSASSALIIGGVLGLLQVFILISGAIPILKFMGLKYDHVGADSRLQMHGSTSEKSPPSKGQSSNTDTVQGKYVNRKSSIPSSINGTNEQKSEVLDWRRNLVATGRVHNELNQTTCHGISFNKEEVVVIVDSIHDGNAELYAPCSFVDILSDVVIGGYIKWHVTGIKYV